MANRSVSIVAFNADGANNHVQLQATEGVKITIPDFKDANGKEMTLEFKWGGNNENAATSTEAAACKTCEECKKIEQQIELGLMTIANWPSPDPDYTLPMDRGKKLTIHLVLTTGFRTAIAIFDSMALKNLMDRFATRSVRSPSQLRYVFEGQRIHGHETPKDCDMRDGDMIDVYLEQMA